jgi:SRSO17 transposase
VFVIGKTPKPLKKFFGNLCPSFTKPQWPHFQALVLVYAMAHGRRNIARMNLFLEDQTQRQRRQDFLVESPWDGAGALNVGARAVLMAMRPQKGELLEVLIDGSHAAKRGKTMEGAHRYFDPVTKSYQFGHAFVLCVLRFRGVAIPWAVRLWLPKAFCRSERGKALGLKFKTSNQIAADMVREIPADLVSTLRVRVLFDSGFLNEEVVGACQERGFRFISVAKSNRVLFPFKYKGKRRVCSYGPGVIRTEGKTIQIDTERGKAKFRVAVRDGYMNGIGAVRVVFSQRQSDQSFVALVTDEMGLAARDVVIGYRARWTIEVTLKSLKQCLGLGQYQTQRYEGLIHHLHLSLISFQLLITLGIQSSAEKLPSSAAIESIPRLQDQLRLVVAKDHFARLRQRKDPVRLLASLRKLLVCA